MDLEVAKKLIKNCMEDQASFVPGKEAANRYYRKENDILFNKIDNGDKDAENPLRNADNRVPSNFYKLQVNQKAAYAFTAPPIFDTGNDTANKVIKESLGDAFAKKCKSLCVQAANNAVGWIHYWKSSEGIFKYAVIDSRQILPVWTKALEKELYAVLRLYSDIEESTGEEYIIYEIWTNQECASYRKKKTEKLEEIEQYNQFTIVDIDTMQEEQTNVYPHGFQEVPFVFFNNNDEMQNDLKDIKELIDSYDKIYSGFVNDLEDIQQIIFILTNYGGEEDNALELLKKIKRQKLVQVESDGAEDKSGVSTLSIEIPVEARKEMLITTRKAIFEQGMAIDPDPQNFGNSSGVALSYLYSLLELKTGMMQTEFMISFNRLIRAILQFRGIKVENIIQTWTRTSVSNDAELADIASKSKGIISDKTLLNNHPWVEDAKEEIDQIKKENKENMHNFDKAPIKKDDVDDGRGKE